MSASPHQVARTSAAVASRFAAQLTRIGPAPGVLQRAEGHLSDIRACLAGSLEVARPVKAGSFYKGTAIKWYSDLDYFVALSRNEVRWGDSFRSSDTVLRTVREHLQARYPNTVIRRDEVAITLAFEQGSAPIDVVPAIYLRHDARLASPVYLMPDGNKSWMETAPDAQKKWLGSATLKSGGKLPKVLQLLKWWARAREVPLAISSYHLESVLIAEGLVPHIGRYSQILASVLTRLEARKGAAVRDPIGLSGLVALASTPAKVEASLRAIGYAAMHARSAIAAEAAGDLSGAVDQWQIVMPEFPR